MTHPKALLAIWHDVEASSIDDYLKWHTFEHLPERLALPGFISARRFEHLEGPGQMFLCLVEVEDTDAFQSDAYLKRLNAPTPWTRMQMPRYGRVHRALCRTVLSVGRGIAPRIACLRFNLREAKPSTEAPGMIASVVETLHEEMMITRAELCVADTALSAQATEEARLRRAESTGGLDYVLCVGSLDEESSAAAVHRIESVMAPMAVDLTVSTYRHSYAVSN